MSHEVCSCSSSWYCTSPAQCFSCILTMLKQFMKRCVFLVFFSDSSCLSQKIFFFFANLFWMKALTTVADTFYLILSKKFKFFFWLCLIFYFSFLSIHFAHSPLLFISCSVIVHLQSKATGQTRPETADCYHFHLEEQSGESLSFSMSVSALFILSLWCSGSLYMLTLLFPF